MTAEPTGSVVGAEAPHNDRAFRGLVDRVRQEIFEGHLHPGDRLPHERAMAQDFGVSRAAVREALRVLEIQGLVRVHHGYHGGVFVAEPSAGVVLDALATSLRLESVRVDDLYEARRLIEPTLARVAVERDGPGVARLLETNLAQADAQRALGQSPFVTNVEFHAILARAGGNQVTTLIMQAVLDLLVARREDAEPSPPGLSSDALDDHRRLVAAIHANDGRLVEALMLIHLTRVHGAVADEPAAQVGTEEVACSQA
jgi:DNA-binding FadR family transcriptional regulator